MSSSPTQRTLAECRRRGWIAQVVEKWIPPRGDMRYGRRVDLFGCIDVVALDTKAGALWGIQACAGASHSVRRAKALEDEKLEAWLFCGGRFAIWSWAKRGARGKRKLWALREEEITE